MTATLSNATSEFVASIAELNDVRATDPGRIARLLATRQTARRSSPAAS